MRQSPIDGVKGLAAHLIVRKTNLRSVLAVVLALALYFSNGNCQRRLITVLSGQHFSPSSESVVKR